MKHLEARGAALLSAFALLAGGAAGAAPRSESGAAGIPPRNLALIGVTQMGDRTQAWLVNTATRQRETVSPGQAAFGYSVKRVGTDRVVLSRGGREFTLQLGERRVPTDDAPRVAVAPATAGASRASSLHLRRRAPAAMADDAADQTPAPADQTYTTETGRRIVGGAWPTRGTRVDPNAADATDPSGQSSVGGNLPLTAAPYGPVTGPLDTSGGYPYATPAYPNGGFYPNDPSAYGNGPGYYGGIGVSPDGVYTPYSLYSYPAVTPWGQPYTAVTPYPDPNSGAPVSGNAQWGAPNGGFYANPQRARRYGAYSGSGATGGYLNPQTARRRQMMNR